MTFLPRILEVVNAEIPGDQFALKLMIFYCEEAIFSSMEMAYPKFLTRLRILVPIRTGKWEFQANMTRRSVVGLMVFRKYYFASIIPQQWPVFLLAGLVIVKFRRLSLSHLVGLSRISIAMHARLGLEQLTFLEE